MSGIIACRSVECMTKKVNVECKCQIYFDLMNPLRSILNLKWISCELEIKKVRISHRNTRIVFYFDHVQPNKHDVRFTRLPFPAK